MLEMKPGVVPRAARRAPPRVGPRQRAAVDCGVGSKAASSCDAAQLCAIGVQMLDGRHVIGLEVAAMDNERVVA